MKKELNRDIILIVDDIQKNIQLLGEQLRQEGYMIAAASTGSAALEIVEKVQPHLILLDIVMPDMDGFEVCTCLKENPKSRDIPVIFLTAKDDTESVSRAFTTGAVDYLTKPFNKVELLARVKTHLNLKRSHEKVLEVNARLRERESQLEEAIATKDRFLSIIGHDLRNPMSVLLLGLQMFSGEEANLEKRRRLDGIYSSAHQIHRAFENILSWSQSQMGRLSFYPENVSLEKVLENVLSLVEMNIEQKQIRLSCHLEDNSFTYVDPNALSTILTNLISNAIKFTRPNGNISIESKKESACLEVTISDDGLGMSPGDLAKLFQVDVCHSSPGTAREKGTGLGLILCQEFIDKSGGEIEVESELGQGSIFRFRLPLPLDEIQEELIYKTNKVIQ